VSPPAALGRTALLREQEPEPARFWVRYAPARWPGPARPWLDLAAGGLGSGDLAGGDGAVLEALGGQRLEDLLYLPPVPPALATARDRLAARQAERGTPVLLQLLPGDAAPAPLPTGVVLVWDLLPVAVADVAMAEVAVALAAGGAAGAAAAWPLAAGVGDAHDLDATAAALAAAGVGALQGAALELSGRDRRDLGSGLAEERYLRLFHGEPASAAALARAAARRGLLPLLPRPLPRPPLHGAGNLRVAAALASTAELCLWLGEPESRAQVLLRAARFAARSPRDLTALARDGNLTVLPWLEGEAREVAAEAARGAEPRLWREMLARLAA
jgi:hypothetical protein